MSSHVGIITAPYVSCVVCLSVFTDGDAYMRRMAFSYTLVSATMNHDGLQVQEAGLFVDMERPYIRASPDGIIKCNCCGLPGDLDKTDFCMIMTNQDGKMILKRNQCLEVR